MYGTCGANGELVEKQRPRTMLRTILRTARQRALAHAPRTLHVLANHWDNRGRRTILAKCADFPSPRVANTSDEPSCKPSYGDGAIFNTGFWINPSDRSVGVIATNVFPGRYNQTIALEQKFDEARQSN